MTPPSSTRLLLPLWMLALLPHAPSTTHNAVVMAAAEEVSEMPFFRHHHRTNASAARLDRRRRRRRHRMLSLLPPPLRRDGADIHQCPCRTKVCFSQPTHDTVRDMFGDTTTAPPPLPRFNHDGVGITAPPCVRDVALSHGGSDSGSSDGRRGEDKVCTYFTSMEGDHEDDDVERSWFPATSSSGSSSSRRRNQPWRILRYRRRVGRGYDCYERVRDAALRWEFANDDGCEQQRRTKSKSMGILRHLPSTAAQQQLRLVAARRSDADATTTRTTSSRPRRHLCRKDDDDAGDGQVDKDSMPSPNEDFSRRVMHIDTGPGRKLMTYSEVVLGRRFDGGGGSGGAIDDRLQSERRKMTNEPINDRSFLRRWKMPRLSLPSNLYVINPVMVVYDAIDQQCDNGPRGSKGVTCYTSTAYATLRGHLLCGEERVTVILRKKDDENKDEKEQKKNSRGNKRVDRTATSSSSAKGGGGYVDVEILSYSRAAPSLVGKLVWPFIGRMQDQFFVSELDALERAAR